MSYEEQLAKIWIFSKLEKSDLARIGKAVVLRKYAKGDQIVKEGEQAVAFYVINSGKVEVTKAGKRLAEMGPGESFGDQALLDGFPRVASISALEDTECLAMTRWDFAAELRTNSAIALALLPVLSQRIRELEDKLVAGNGS